MSPVTLVFGWLLILLGFVTLVRRLHDRSVHESLALLRSPGGQTPPAIAAFVRLFVPVVAPIATGIASFLVALAD